MEHETHPAAAEKLTVRVLRMAPEGKGVAKAEGSSRVIFVTGAAPGDVCEVEVQEAKSSFARARILRLIEPGPDRIDPPCALHQAPGRPGPSCGGCDWQHLSYEAQLRHKAEVVRDCVERIGKLKDVPVLPTLPSPKPWGYRNKVLVPFGMTSAPQAPRPNGPLEGAVRSVGEHLTAGFYSPGSHNIVNFSACPVQPDLSVRIVLKAKAIAESLGWRPHDESANRGFLRHLFVRTNGQGKALVTVVTRSTELPQAEAFITRLRAEAPEVLGIHHNVQPLKTSVVLGPQWRCLWGARALEEKLGRFSFMVSPAAFLQVNTEAAVVLYDAALAALREGGRAFDKVLDIYSGVGTLTLWLSQAAKLVVGVEENRDAVRDAWKNAERNSIKNVRFSAGRAESVLPRLVKEGLGKSVAAVVDPPRAGVSVPVLRFLTGPTIKRVVYVSCNPGTFARDADYLCRSGYKLLRVQPVDLFPQTSHVELVGLLERPGT